MCVWSEINKIFQVTTAAATTTPHKKALWMAHTVIIAHAYTF